MVCHCCIDWEFEGKLGGGGVSCAGGQSTRELDGDMG